ncbi:MAG: transcriptional regulator [Thiobacillus sp. GWE1_62_9]|nr:MAG: transcriptional regulator [Thiobacillus sp. GWE1_62_9]HBU30326.1 transcriptional regulator [Thiobacillus sp.]
MAKQETPTNFDDLPASAQVPARTLASLLHISEVTVWRWSKDGRLPKPRKLGPASTRWVVGEVRAALAKLAA